MATFKSEKYRNGSTRPQPAALPSQPTQEQIQVRAYYIWQAKGCPTGQENANWLEAERQLKTEQGRK